MHGEILAALLVFAIWICLILESKEAKFDYLLIMETACKLSRDILKNKRKSLMSFDYLRFQNSPSVSLNYIHAIGIERRKILFSMKKSQNSLWLSK